MDLNLQIYDNFLEDPDEYRAFAIRQPYSVRGRYPGARANFVSENYLKMLVEKLTFAIGRKVEHVGASTMFQAITENEDYNWIHHDGKDVAGILYLTPNAPVEYGTSIYRHKPTGHMSADEYIEEHGLHRQEENWEEVIRVGNVYNRLVLYNGNLYHKSTNTGFGKNMNDCRLTQTFFMNFVEEK